MTQASIICLFCSDIREEKQETDTIIGILPDNILVPRPTGASKGAFPKLALYARAHAPIDDPPSSLSLRLEMPDGETIDLGAMPSEEIELAIENARKKESPYLGLIMKAVLHNFPIGAAGRVRVIACLDDKEYLAGALNVQFQEEAASLDVSEAKGSLG